MIFFWGMGGALIYATNSLILQLWNKGATPSDRTKAILEYALALVTGGLFALGMTEVFQAAFAKGVTINALTIRGDFEEVPVALTIGWASNYLWPKVLRKLGEVVEKRNAT